MVEGGRSSRTSSVSRNRNTKTEESPDSKNKKDDPKDKKKKDKDVGTFGKTVGQLIMTVRNVSGTYSINDGILLPGFKNANSLFGLDNNFSSPSFAFVSGAQNYDLFGRQSDVWGADSSFANFAANNEWLVQQPTLNLQHNVMHYSKS